MDVRDRFLERTFEKLGLPYPKPSAYALELARKYGYLPYMIERYMHIFGSREELIEFLEAVEKGLPRYIRCNTLAIKNCMDLAERLREVDIIVKPVPWLPHAFRVENNSSAAGRLGSTLEYLLGYYYIQGLGSMAVSIALNPKPGEAVADLAAAPGGKTTHIAQLMNNDGIILSVEKNPVRAMSLSANIQRMRVKIAAVLVKDILELPIKEKFDKVLLDAPCTGEGLLPIKKERKTSKDLGDIARMHELQVKLLEKSLQFVKPGGVLVYSTCSIAPEENEFVIDKVLSSRSDVELEKITGIMVGSPGLTEFMGYRLRDGLANCLRLYPHKNGSEGFFMCRLRRRGK
ncbi:MAG: RsmB/NOP family class I SAM-dependent RNA methyltransferase [Fervidicoccaceae archaeon]